MPEEAQHDPALMVALALVAGMSCQILARHLGIPGIVLLLAAGTGLGIDGIGVIDTHSLSSALPHIVNFAVAVILFEGALNLNLTRIRRQVLPIRRLLTVGALVTGLLGGAIGYFVLDWNRQVSALFGALVIVTGPTVVNPLLRRIRVERSVGTVLEAEGVFIDAIGAILAVVVMEITIDPVEATLGPLHMASRLGVGAAFGLAGGAVIAWLFRRRSVIPSGLENVTALALALGLFQVSSAVMPESGIAAVIVAGMVVGNLRPHIWRELHDFKEQLTILLIGLLFILLAADVRLATVTALGWRGIAAVLLLIFVARPLAVFLATHNTKLSWRQRLFVAWIGPRGIVAAAVASVFATELDAHGIEGARALRAMVFLTIGVTVVLAGLTGGFVAHWLGLRRPRHRGWVLLGANALARELAALLAEDEQDVVCIDSNPESCRVAEEQGVRVIYGNGLSDSVLRRAELDTRTGAIGVTRSDEMNYLFTEVARTHERDLKTYVALGGSEAGVTSRMLEEAQTERLAGMPCQVDRWSRWLEEESVERERWKREHETDEKVPVSGIVRDDETTVRSTALPLVLHRRAGAIPVGDLSSTNKGDEVTVLVFRERSAEAHSWLRAMGFGPVEARSPEPVRELVS